MGAASIEEQAWRAWRDHDNARRRHAAAVVRVARLEARRARPGGRFELVTGPAWAELRRERWARILRAAGVKLGPGGALLRDVSSARGFRALCARLGVSIDG